MSARSIRSRRLRIGYGLAAHLIVEAEAMQEDWLLRNKEAINADLDKSFAQAVRGEGYSPEESRARPPSIAAGD